MPVSRGHVIASCSGWDWAVLIGIDWARGGCRRFCPSTIRRQLWHPFLAIEAGEEVADFAEEFVEAEAVEGDSILELGVGKAIRTRARGGTREKNVYGRFLMSSKARE